MITVDRILGHLGADIAPYRLRAALADEGADAAPALCGGAGWALAAGRGRSGGGVAVALAGRLDVRLPLLTRIEAAGGAVAERDHAALIGSAYEADGTDVTARLEGAYALAVVDTRGAPVVVLATDDAGTTPLYYHWDAAREELRFATRVTDLLALLRARPSLWEPGLDAYLTTGAPLDGQTLIDGVRSLPPRTTAVCARGRGLRLIRRDTGPGGSPPGTARRAGAGERGQGRPPAPAGSGTRPPDTPLPAPRCADLPELLPALAWSLGQPDADPAALTSYALYASAHRAGLRTMLAADAVDEIGRGRRRVDAAADGTPDSAVTDGIARYVDTLGTASANARFGLYSSDYRAYLTDRGDTARRLTERLGEEAAGGSRRATLTGFELDVLLPARGLRRTAHLSGAHAVRATLPSTPRQTWAAPATEVAERYRAARRTTAARTLLTGDNPLTRFVREVLSAERLKASGMLDAHAVGRLVDAQLARPGTRLAGTVWALLMFELWRAEYGVVGRHGPCAAPLARTPADLPALGRRAVPL
ncbi:hypothetical protein [Streptomyces sp. NPDC088789]|uniref:hypothetical protein n=1 Tax=Streptomyces sp. NPDC088789 TaxID=3365899 RepID=UPI0038008E92